VLVFCRDCMVFFPSLQKFLGGFNREAHNSIG
jgi:hypothetical protein